MLRLFRRKGTKPDQYDALHVTEYAHMKEPPPPAPHRGVILILRDGRRLGIANLSLTNAKHLRRGKGTFTFRGPKGSEIIKGAQIRSIRPLPPTA